MGALLVRVASAYFGLSDETDVFREGRMPATCRVRWAVSMVLHQDIGWGKKRIAKFLIKDKKAVHYGLKRAEALYRSDARFFDGVELLRKEVFP
ncbi:hypothetical protein KNJ79_04945 [Sphingopyxis indica]|uniref:hypothetical protein n=1 Tax=Sphingopyxis indica TaxID=436663 RepID=UPI00293910D2|nr:hypothetical protein [Sphingopyxis indica]WOF44278.1 hypothetical protein KNJ79_04945 [Sphingopyxis indica]